MPRVGSVPLVLSWQPFWHKARIPWLHFPEPQLPTHLYLHHLINSPITTRLCYEYSKNVHKYTRTCYVSWTFPHVGFYMWLKCLFGTIYTAHILFAKVCILSLIDLSWITTWTVRNMSDCLWLLEPYSSNLFLNTWIKCIPTVDRAGHFMCHAKQIHCKL